MPWLSRPHSPLIVRWRPVGRHIIGDGPAGGVGGVDVDNLSQVGDGLLQASPGHLQAQWGLVWIGLKQKFAEVPWDEGVRRQALPAPSTGGHWQLQHPGPADPPSPVDCANIAAIRQGSPPTSFISGSRPLCHTWSLKIPADVLKLCSAKIFSLRGMIARMCSELVLNRPQAVRCHQGCLRNVGSSSHGEGQRNITLQSVY